MVDALTVTANGLIAAQRRATDLATEILASASDGTNSGDSSQGQTAEPYQAPSNIPSNQGRPLVQQIAELKTAELQFKASAKAFETAAETQNSLLGTLIDDEG